jgi:heme exporter protein D
MNWSSPAEFFDMGGHGLFVWGSYGVCLLVMTLEPLLAARRRRRALAEADAQQGNLSLRDEEDE